MGFHPGSESSIPIALLSPNVALGVVAGLSWHWLSVAGNAGVETARCIAGIEYSVERGCQGSEGLGSQRSYPKVGTIRWHGCAGYVRRVTHDEIADTIG